MLGSLVIRGLPATRSEPQLRLEKSAQSHSLAISHHTHACNKNRASPETSAASGSLLLRGLPATRSEPGLPSETSARKQSCLARDVCSIGLAGHPRPPAPDEPPRSPTVAIVRPCGPGALRGRPLAPCQRGRIVVSRFGLAGARGPSVSVVRGGFARALRGRASGAASAPAVGGMPDDSDKAAALAEARRVHGAAVRAAIVAARPELAARPRKAEREQLVKQAIRAVLRGAPCPTHCGRAPFSSAVVAARGFSLPDGSKREVFGTWVAAAVPQPNCFRLGPRTCAIALLLGKGIPLAG